MREILESLDPILVCMIVCASKATELTIQSLKTCMLVKGHKLRAAMLGFTECTVWGLVTSSVVTTLNGNIALLLFYCAGYSIGMILGSTLEKKIAVGTTCIELLAREEKTEDVTEYLKAHHRGYTIVQGRGAVGVTNVVIVILPRKDVKKTLKGIRKLCDDRVFAVTGEVSKYVGGYGVSK